MAFEYAALLDTTNGSARPVGVALATGHAVIVDLPKAYGIPVVHEGEYRVLQPNLTEIIYRPGDDGYLDQVLADLSWCFAVGERGALEILDTPSYARLRARLEAEHYARERTGTYEPANTVAHGYVVEYENTHDATDALEPAVVAGVDDLALVA